MFSVTCGQLCPEADDAPSDEMSEGQREPSAKSQRLRHSPHFISSRRHFIISHHHKRKKH
ncbi:annexin A3 isoform X1 [Prionailurus iriomotensis]